MSRYPTAIWFISVALFIGGCDALVTINNRATPCSADSDCRDRLFCSQGFCLRNSSPRCGDGQVNADAQEACDDGNRIDDDGCNNSCVIARCGDAVVRTDLATDAEGYEACDDGNRSDSDDCTNICKRALCGDGIMRVDLDEGEANYEACDDGNANDVGACTSTCRVARCGDGYLREDLAPDDADFEVCDGSERCDDQCQLTRCGDGARQAGMGEACDDGNAVEDDACRNDCSAARCGDGIVRGDLETDDEGFEACDDGDEVETDDCTTACAKPACGDGFLQGDELCDDGNRVDDDDCSNGCGVGIVDIHFQSEGLCVIKESGAVFCAGYANTGRNYLGRSLEYGSYGFGQVEGLPEAIAFAGPNCVLSTEEALWCWGLYEAPAAQIYGAGERWRRFVGCWRDTCYALSAQGQVWRLDRRTKRKISRITSLPISTDLIGTSRDFCVLSEAGTLHCGRDGHRFIQLPLTGIRAVQSTPDLSWLFIDKHQGEDLLLNLPRSNSSSPTRFGTLVSELANSDTLEIIAPDAPDNRTAIRRVARPGTPPSLKGAAKLQNDAWLVLTEDQRVLSWGNSRLLAREGDATPAAEITALRGSFMLGGRDPYCVINQDRRLVCWGSNSRGKMGIPIQEQTPFRVQLDSTVRQVALGSGHTCALNDNGTIDCWGGSEVVGAGLTTQRIYARPTLIPNFGQIERVQGRGNTTCADNAQNHLFCWGSGSQGQFGIGSITHYYRPERLTQWAHLRDLRVGRTRFCGLNDQGVVYCAGELGIPAEPGSRYSLRSAEPVALPDLPAIAQLSVGQPVCGLTAEGQLFCWGQSIALFGDRNPRRPQAIAQAPAATTAYANLSDGFPSYAAICIQTVAGETMCSSHEGPLSTLAVPPSPVVAIDMGGCNCMLLEDRTVWCWGPDWTHQCEGNQCLEPTQVPGLPPITQIAVGLAHACAVGADGSLWCWGDNTSGQLGNGVHGRDYQYPTLIDGY